jgi:hypothetical protein
VNPITRKRKTVGVAAWRAFLSAKIFRRWEKSIQVARPLGFVPAFGRVVFRALRESLFSQG